MNKPDREKAWRELNINEWRLKLRSTTDQKKAAELLDAMYDLGFEKARELEGLRHTNLGEVTYTKCRRCGADRQDGKFEICCM